MQTNAYTVLSKNIIETAQYDTIR